MRLDRFAAVAATVVVVALQAAHAADVFASTNDFTVLRIGSDGRLAALVERVTARELA